MLIDRLIGQYGKIRAELQPSEHDVRPFAWWNYGGDPHERFTIEARYTARLGPLAECDDDELLAGMRAVRRREIRRLLMQQEPIRRPCHTPEVLQSAYQSVLERQQIPVDSQTLGTIETLWQLTQSGFGRALSWSLGPEVPEVAYALLLDDRTAAHLVLKLSAPEFVSDALSAFAVFDAVRDSRSLPLQQFDFNGANSPKRGDDKHSYGAGPVLYFQVSYG